MRLRESELTFSQASMIKEKGAQPETAASGNQKMMNA